jgi:transposase
MMPAVGTAGNGRERQGAAAVVQLGELMMILVLHRQGLSVTAIARRTRRDPETIRKYIETRLGAAGLRAAPGWPAQQDQALS